MKAKFGSRSHVSATGLVVLGLTACTANVSQGPMGGQNGTAGTTGTGAVGASTGSNGGVQGACSPESALAPARLWQLTDQEYVGVVGQLLGVPLTGSDAEVTQPATETGEFTNLSELLQVNSPAVHGYQAAAEKVAALAVANLAALVPCASATPTEACVQQFIQTKVARTFRRPLLPVEVQDLMTLYRVGAPDGASVGVRLVIEGVLQSPSFIYRSETGGGTAIDGKGPIALTPYEIASALSFFFYEAGPDDTLWAKAQDGSLARPEVVATEVDRLMALPQSQANLNQKAAFWLGVERFRGTEKDPIVFPEFTPTLKDSLYQGAQLFLKDILWSGHISDLLTSKRMYVNAESAKLYGISGVTGTALVPVDVASGERSAGILTQPAVLASYSRPNRGDPIHRGLFVYNSLVCGATVGSPPPGALATAATFPANATERQLATLRAGMYCKGCHGLFDPLGLATERYDAIGRYHATDSTGAAIDSSTVIAGLGPDLDGSIAGVDELAAKLKTGRRVTDCAASILTTFAIGRDVKTDRSCNMVAVKDKFASSGSFGDLFRALATSPGFVKRNPDLK
jgi:Protein of unknown function (DUF1592)/Protein of unknown function (DUF1588)/Protein of unknown function (DUF1595)/Protein of unknown function (DUF1585)/Protein of unknown function (DUF1587)